MNWLTFWGPFALTVLSNVLYHNIAKWTPISLNPMLGLGVTYLVSFVICVIGYYFSGGVIRQDIQALNWVSVAWGIVLVGIEVGYLLLYRAGWEISLAPLMVNVTGAVILIAIGVGLYNESLTMKQGIGIIFCLLGFFLVRV